MQSFSILAAVLSAVAGIASAYTTPVNGPIGNPISRPGLHEKVPVGKPFQITWVPNHNPESTVTLVLVKGPSNNVVPQYAIVERLPNNGNYYWTPDASLPDSTEGWGIQLIVDSTGDYQWSTQFGFENSAPVEPTTSTTVIVVPTTTATIPSSTTTPEAVYTTTTEEESDYPTTTTTEEESDYPVTTTEVEEPTTTSAPDNTTTTEGSDYPVTTTTPEVETTTTPVVEEEPTYVAPTTLSTIQVTPTNSTSGPSNTSAVTPPVVTDSGVSRNAASFGMAVLAVAVAGFSLL